MTGCTNLGFGKLVRALGFYPVSQGIENGMDQLKEKIAQGYSLLFSLKQNVLIPMMSKDSIKEHFTCRTIWTGCSSFYIHGNSEVLPKGDFIIYDGSITVKVGDRISKDDLSFGKIILKEQKRSTPISEKSLLS
jgi:hypothetical protein